LYNIYQTTAPSDYENDFTISGDFGTKYHPKDLSPFLTDHGMGEY